MDHRDIAEEVIKKFVKQHKPEKILEIGAGETSFTHCFNTDCYATIDIDIDHIGKNTIMDVHNLKFLDESFDCVLICHAAEHFINPIKAFKEIHRVLTPGGKVLSITPVPCVHQITNGDKDHVFVLGPMQWKKILTYVMFNGIECYYQLHYKDELIKPYQNCNVITIGQK